MQVSLCYFFMYILEAFIFYDYCNNLFEQKRTRHQTILIIGICSLVEYLASFFHQSIINISLFVIFCLFMLVFLYHMKQIHAIFHTAILTTAMCGSELVIAPIFTNNIWSEQSLLHNLMIQAPLCKLVYFVIVKLIVHIFKGFRSENYYTSIANFILTIISVLTLIILYSLFSLYTGLPLDTTQRILMITNAVII